MNGVDRDGEAVEHNRRSAPPVPKGKLSRRQVADEQAKVLRAYMDSGYSQEQAGQIINQCPRTTHSRLKGAPQGGPRPGRPKGI